MGKTDQNQLAPHIRALLSSLRWRIRLFVWIEGLAVGILWFGLTFWAGLALDYLPILLGASELPRPARAVLLGIIAAVLAVILYRWIMRRTFVRLADRSMAVLLERKYGQLRDSLMTSVELHAKPDHAAAFNAEMLRHTSTEALERLGDVRLGPVFNTSPLLTKIGLGMLLIVPIGIFYAVNARALEIWVNRIYLLKDEPWPRRARVEVVGIEVEAADGAQSPATQLIPFEEENQSVKVAAGSNVTLRVRADSTRPTPPPEVCTIYYQTAENDRGRVNMVREGIPRDGFQRYKFDGKPFRGILTSLQFDVRGLDHTVRNYRIEVVENPAVVSADLDCHFPEYMVDETTSSWFPRVEPYRPGVQFPRGTQITIMATANKELTEARIYNPETDESVTLPIPADAADRHRFEYQIASLDGNMALEVTLHDIDGVVRKNPSRWEIACVEDQAPLVDVHLQGIGTAITPDALVAVQGEVRDDYGVAESWFELFVNDSDIRQFPFPLGKAGAVQSDLDFREQRSMEGGVELKAQDKLVLLVKAKDKYDLAGGPNIGSGDRYELDVVTADELLRMLERKELGLRVRFEQIISEMSDMRDSLARIKDDLSGDSNRGAEPEDVRGACDAEGAEPGEQSADEQKQSERAHDLRLLLAQRALIQSQKSAQETLGVAVAFEDIRSELVNNRVVDAEDRKIRLQQQIADPLKLVAETMFPEMDRLLGVLEKQVDEVPPAEAALDQANEILAELDAVLQKMLELENYNDLVELVRRLLERQEEAMQKTKQEQARQLLDLVK